MLYTIIPEEEVFNEMEEDSRSYLDVEVNGCTMQIEPIDHFSGTVVRVTSSNPQDYLNPMHQPGSVIQWG